MKSILASSLLLFLVLVMTCAAFAEDGGGGLNVSALLGDLFSGQVSKSAVAVAAFLYSMLETWIGKSQKMKENSIPATLWTFGSNFLKGGYPAAISATFRRFDRNGGGEPVGGGGGAG